jgi:hypothetical protein
LIKLAKLFKTFREVCKNFVKFVKKVDKITKNDHFLAPPVKTLFLTSFEKGSKTNLFVVVEQIL